MEYDWDKLVFKGEYFNGKRWNGKGIESSEDSEKGLIIIN